MIACNNGCSAVAEVKAGCLTVCPFRGNRLPVYRVGWCACGCARYLPQELEPVSLVVLRHLRPEESPVHQSG